MAENRANHGPAPRYLRPPSPLFFPVDEQMPESAVHLRVRTALFLLLDRRLRGRAYVGSDQFVYWDPVNPRQSLAPDALVRMGGPLELLPAFKVWEHGAPHVAVEIVSESDRSEREWEEKLERYRRSGIAEVVRFDGEALERPLRLWDALDGDLVERDLSGEGGSYSATLAAYWCVKPDATLGLTLRLSEDAAGTRLWLTPEEAEQVERAGKEAERLGKEAERQATERERAAREAERAAKEAERAEKEAERAAKEAERAEKEAALRRVAELEAELSRRTSR